MFNVISHNPRRKQSLFRDRMSLVPADTTQMVPFPVFAPFRSMVITPDNG